MTPFTFFSGYKTYIAAVGLVFLMFFQLSVYDLPGAAQSFFAALAAVGLRHAISQSQVAK